MLQCSTQEVGVRTNLDRNFLQNYIIEAAASPELNSPYRPPLVRLFSHLEK